MTEIAQSIDLNLAEKLRDQGYRQKFFLAEVSAGIARQLIALRKRRALDQGQLAVMIGTQQPAISRIEKADYQNWSFSTLRRIAAALDARIMVTIEPAEDVLCEYETQSELPLAAASSAASTLVQTQVLEGTSSLAGGVSLEMNSPPGDWAISRYSIPWQRFFTQPPSARQLIPDDDNKDQLIADLRAKIASLQNLLTGTSHQNQIGITGAMSIRQSPPILATP